MQQHQILERVKLVVFETFGADPSSLSTETAARDVQGWDSIGHLIFVSGVESAFNVQLPMEAAMKLANVDDVVALVHQQLPG